MSFAGKLAVITGAGGGIGAAICRRLCAEGAHVIGTDVAGHAPADVDGSFEFQPLDLTDATEIAAFGAAIATRCRPVDILINNAGLILGKPLVETTGADIDRLFAVNVRAPLLLMAALAPSMAPTGSITNMSSAAAVKPIAQMSAYGASKGALLMATKVAAMELAPIRVNVVLPGTIDTPMPRAFIERVPEAEQAGAISKLIESRLVKRFGEPDEIASLVLYLASDAASFITAAEFTIDGGRL